MAEDHITKITPMNERLDDRHTPAPRMDDAARFARGVAHDLNNLLSPILGAAELGLAELEPGSTQYTDLEQIREAALRIHNLARELLAVGRAQRLLQAPIDLNELIAEQEQPLRRLLREGQQIELRLATDLGIINGDTPKVCRVLTNLVLNARDAMPEGGTVTISTANVVLGGEQSSGEGDLSPGPHVMITVSDVGLGMDDETRDQAFEPYFTTRDRGEGKGLGLAVIHGIVKQHRGVVWLSSRLGEGTAVHVCFPRTDESAEGSRP
jgi:signal transduction histidine kinase